MTRKTSDSLIGTGVEPGVRTAHRKNQALDHRVLAREQGTIPIGVLFKEPEYLFDGLVAIADGVKWDPLADGRFSLVVYNNSVWTKVGPSALGPGDAHEFRRDFAADGNSQRNVAVFIRSYSGGNGATGIGATNVFQIENTTGVLKTIGRYTFVTTDATNGSENADYKVLVVSGGTLVEVLKLDSNKDATFQRGVAPGNFTDATRPAATAVPTGSMIWNTEDVVPNWSDGADWRSPPLTIRKTADQTIQSDTTVNNDTHLFYAAQGTKTYGVTFTLMVRSQANADFKFAITVPAGATAYYEKVGTEIMVEDPTEITVLTNDSPSRAKVIIECFVVMGAPSGNIQLQWAQVTSQATNTTVFKGSIMRVTTTP